MQNAIEKKGCWPHDGLPLDPEAILKVLSDRIGATLDTKPQLLHDTLSHALRQGNLSYTQADGTIRWQWVDFI